MASNPESVLQYYPEQQRTDSSAIAWFVFIAPLMVLIIVGMIARDFAWPAAILTAVVMIWRKKKAKLTPHAVLEVESGNLRVRDRTGKTILDAPLDEILNVALDTKTIQKVQENMSSGVPDVRFIDSRVGPSIDNSRIEIQHGGETLLLTERYTSNIDASEWFSKIRRLLRKNGWKPLDEREDGPTNNDTDRMQDGDS
jgi:hypothetical protein